MKKHDTVSCLSRAFAVLLCLFCIASSHAQPDGWVNIRTAAPSIVLDIRYATTNNFVNAQMYPCAECFLRSPAAEALLAAHSELQKQGYGLKMFDCYRPAPVQERLWAKMPDARYVTNPRKGSMHGRGGAADLTIVDAQGKELDMGTPFDYFGAKAYPDYPHLPANVLKNRLLLRTTMERHGFRHIRTEWWHFAYIPKQYSVANWEWECAK